MTDDNIIRGTNWRKDRDETLLECHNCLCRHWYLRGDGQIECVDCSGVIAGATFDVGDGLVPEGEPA